MRFLGAISILVIVAVAAGQVPVYRVKPEFPRQLRLDRVLERVDPDNDLWVGEQDFEAINTKLKQIAESMRKGEAGLEGLSDSLSRFDRLTLVEFKIVASSRSEADAQNARVRVRCEFGGQTPDDRLLSFLGYIQTHWSRSEGDWNLTKVELESIREVSSPLGYFTDVTEQAVGHNPSYREQLSLGVDHWRTVLDEALGISVYGHNGISVGDYNGDGFEDLYISQPSGLPNRLYRNTLLSG